MDKPLVLVVDDQPEMAELIADMVAWAGYPVLLAEGGAAALALARAHRPDIILSDLMMPDVDGWELLRELRAFLTSPVIFITSHATPNNRRRAQAMGAYGLLSKSISPDVLAQKLRGALAGVKSV